ncbi:IS630 family transposase [Pantoea dispersa]|uniref:IS630 family transposase n=1 Tax=Pantoea dispersa TaxID=59814 RepID=UPI001CA6CE11|nr:IS630 family transposase [Pantoea dispersa]QZY97683.1 IS630 family transposase [Pantoea dispersa]
MNIRLSPEQIAALEAQHRLSRDRRVCDRIRCVLLSAQGWSTAMIAQSQLIHETTVLRHIADYLHEDKLTSENGGSQEHLCSAHSAELICLLTADVHVNAASIVALVRERFGASYSIPGMNKWLHRNGFSWKKPTGVPHKFSEEKQQQFMAEYEALKLTAGDKEPILFMDAVHPTQSTKLSGGWIRRGERKPVKTIGSRTRMNIIGALSLNDIARTVTADYKQINARTICEFFIAIRQTYPVRQKIHLILPYHRASLVQDWAVVMNIELHYLPPYSPNLNPIERLWKVMNEHARNNRYFATAKAFRLAINEFFSETLPEIAGKLSYRINDNFQTLKPASP